MRLYANQTHSVFEEDAGTYEVWTNDETEFIESYSTYQDAQTSANRLEEETG